MAFNEDSRVKIPALGHLTRLGYRYLSLKKANWEKESNIFPEIFFSALQNLNPASTAEDHARALQELTLLLDNEDLGKAFYERLFDTSLLKLIDFEDFSNNSLHAVTELTCQNGDDEFRPDITLLVNGLPLVFIEVKKPNNRDGVIAERDRINVRFRNPKFRRFINATQLMVFSNNMEYDDDDPEPIQGAYYATTAVDFAHFNYFREEEKESLPCLPSLDAEVESFILSDTNLQSIQHAPEYATNKSPDSATNRLLTSLFAPARLQFLLRFGLTYVKTKLGYEKHIMRYPQLFATKAIANTLDEGKRSGIIWHTQGSGKTALAYYNVAFLTHYFQPKGIVPKFYFIVDRIDLLDQASREFSARGLIVHKISSRQDFAKDIKSNIAAHNHGGAREITVVNIQKFKDDPDVVKNQDYALGLQRVYFLDEVHRSYNPEGSFLANLQQSDPQAIRVGLTGTPLLSRKMTSKEKGKKAITFDSKVLFGDYIHKYYYNASIADGYTLRLIREQIETQFQAELREILTSIDVQKGSSERTFVYAHHKFVAPMLKYIVQDLETARIANNDSTIAGMVICDSADQAKEMAKQFAKNHGTVTQPANNQPGLVAEHSTAYHFTPKQARTVKTASLILHDVGSKSERKAWVEDFTEGQTDLLFVYNMLLTGFDARRLKKLYLGRVIKDHNLLQALTRVNRTYKKFRYGYVVDFANIQSEFDKANAAYLKELQAELGDDLEHYEKLFKSPEEITAEIEQIKDALFHFDLTNAEVFNQQISEINDREKVRDLVKSLNTARSLYNLIRLSGQYEHLEALDFRKLNTLATVAESRLTLLNQKAALENNADNTNLLNLALEEIVFAFHKTDEHELRLADELKQALRRTREALGGNFDPGDPEFISLYDELKRLFEKKNLTEVTAEEMATNIAALDSIYERHRELQRQNKLILAKYDNDEKYARIHKRLLEKKDPTDNERKLCEALTDLKLETDLRIQNNKQLLTVPAFAEEELQRLIIEQFYKTHHLPLNPDNTRFIKSLLMKEYLAEFNGQKPA
ncbi:type I restriction endonuclease subunit R [Roseibacillus persicicus]|uniref:type I restriction endonuclease subunit R n=1 Tax=Roseibacillus persicicus TaxID=454148 RepID=UPI00280D6E58|nr:type I restriction endonuclease [Roseibacillus persicicus]MDQ8189542.1 type I restriction endonuclease [Roseibacillus persicicus]